MTLRGAPRRLFLDYVGTLSELRDQPRWDKAITTNCTTSIRTQHAAAERRPWDWRILVSGYAGEMLFEHGSLRTGGLPFAERKVHSLVSPRAQAASDSPDFSTCIRSHFPPEAGSPQPSVPFM